MRVVLIFIKSVIPAEAGIHSAYERAFSSLNVALWHIEG